MPTMTEQTSTKKFENEKEGIDFDDLQQNVEGLLTLLKFRDTDLSSWHKFVKKRLQNLHKFTSKEAHGE